MAISNLDDLKALINIVDVVKSFIPLKNEHGTHKALCPFHNEKTPSFVLSEQKGLFHCFGCKESGDAISFVQKFKHCDFNEATQYIANLYNFELKYSGAKVTQKKDFYAFYARLNEAFKANLLKHEKLLKYFEKRGLNKDDLAYFDIGLVPENGEIYKLIGDDLALGLDLGIIKKGEFGYYSPFAKRLSFALKNTIFKIVGFSCRLHNYENFSNQSKYINSQESNIFKKSMFLYNLNFAKTAYFKENTHLVIVEGFFDAIALSKLGHKSVVASCGSSFNQTHLATLLKQGISNFALCFDNDDAGLNATLKTCELLFKHGYFEAQIWQIPSIYKDIGEILEKNPNAHCDEIFTKINAFEFYIRTKLENKQSALEKDKFINAVFKSINCQKNYFLKKFCIEILQIVTGFEFENIQKVYLNRANFELEKAVFKSALCDERAHFIVAELLNDACFDEYKKSFEYFINTGELDEMALKLKFDENVSVLSADELDEACKSLYKNFLKNELTKAKIARNFSLICEINAKISRLSND